MLLKPVIAAQKHCQSHFVRLKLLLIVKIVCAILNLVLMLDDRIYFRGYQVYDIEWESVGCTLFCEHGGVKAREAALTQRHYAATDDGGGGHTD